MSQPGTHVNELRLDPARNQETVTLHDPCNLVRLGGIIEESRRYIDTLAGKGGYILALGGGTAAGTPPEHLNAMVTAAEQAALDQGTTSLPACSQ